MPEIILASSSQYRKKLLESLNITARCIAPNIDEAALADESPKATALRLAKAKAAAIAIQLPSDEKTNSIIIGSDQVAWLDGAQLGKPGTREKAIAQLKQQSGKTVLFYTALCVQMNAQQYSDVIITEVAFRDLSEQEIAHYIEKDNPIDCAGSFKSEGAGCMLLTRVTSDDPSALIGLPLIRTTEYLRRFGVNPLLRIN